MSRSHDRPGRPRLLGGTCAVLAVLAVIGLLERPVGGTAAAAVHDAGVASGAVPAAVVVPGASTEPCPDLQALVDGTPAGGRAEVRACTYRTQVTIHRPIHLVGVPGAVILGSDRWTAWEGRRSVDRVPVFEGQGDCRDDRPLCDAPEAVHRDGLPLEQVDGRTPGPGEFRMLEDRRVELGDDPGAALIEVVVRDHWLDVRADDVTVAGFVMRHAANAAQTGAVRVAPGTARLTIRDCELSHAAGANVSIGVADDSVIEDCDIHHAGQLGVHLGGDGGHGQRNVVRRSLIRENGTGGFDPEWEAGGLKATRQTGLVLTGNTVHGNAGPGLWCDIDCRAIEVSDNAVHDNTHAGILFEIGQGAAITGNAVWANGADKPGWGWGAGILISSSGGADVRDNTLAWNAAGITVISQDRDDAPADITGTVVADNVVVGHDDRLLTAWLQDWSRGTLFEPGSGNGGGGNRYWTPGDRPDAARFEWDGPIDGMAAAAATPAERGSTYLAAADVHGLLTAAGIPPHGAAPVAPDPIPRALRGLDRDVLALGAALAALLPVGAFVVLLLVRRRRRSAA